MSDENERSVASDGSAAGDPRKCQASAAQVSLVPAEMYHALVVAHEEVARLRLTDAEREAVAFAAERLLSSYVEEREIALALRGLLERTK